MHSCHLYSPAKLNWQSEEWQLRQVNEQTFFRICGPLQIFLDPQHRYLQKAKGNGEDISALNTEYGLNVMGGGHTGAGQII